MQRIRNSLAAVVAPGSVVGPEAAVAHEAVVVPETVVVSEEVVAPSVPWQHQDEDPLASADRLREIEKSLELIGQEVRQGQHQDVVESEGQPEAYDLSDNWIDESSKVAAVVDGLLNNENIDIDSIDDGYVSGNLYLQAALVIRGFSIHGFDHSRTQNRE